MHKDHEELLKTRKLTNRKIVKNEKGEIIGMVEEYGELNMEKLVKRLLKSEAITGRKDF